MGNRGLLELVWQSVISPSEGPRAQHIERLLAELLPVRVIGLTACCELGETRVLTDETELEPALALGDVLAEELSLDVPYGTLVVIESARGRGDGEDSGALSERLGEILGEVLLGVIRRGVFPFEQEAHALFAMGSSYHRLAQGGPLLELGLVPERFSAGLAATLAHYWAGAAFLQDGAGAALFESHSLRNYLRQTERGLAGFEPAYPRAALMRFEGGPFGYEKWLAMVKRKVLAEIEGVGQPNSDQEILR
jgi:hypothetical protein